MIGLGYYAFLNSEKQSNENFNSLNLVPYNSTYFVSEIEFPMQTFDEIFNSNLIWKELISDIQFKEFKNFWVECDSIFSENKLVPEHLTFAACGNKENPNLFFSIKIKDDIEFEDLKFDKKWFVKPIKNTF